MDARYCTAMPTVSMRLWDAVKPGAAREGQTSRCEDWTGQLGSLTGLSRADYCFSTIRSVLQIFQAAAEYLPEMHRSGKDLRHG